jgi:hypothetical protein
MSSTDYYITNVSTGTDSNGDRLYVNQINYNSYNDVINIDMTGEADTKQYVNFVNNKLSSLSSYGKCKNYLTYDVNGNYIIETQDQLNNLCAYLDKEIYT